jgi:hypothetical protein
MNLPRILTRSLAVLTLPVMMAGCVNAVELDASGIRKGMNYFMLTKNQVRRPGDIAVTSINPALLTLEGVTR